MPNTVGGREHGAGNYSDTELTHLYNTMEEIRPIGPDEWQEVSDKHSEKYPGRDVDSIRRKYASHHRKTIPTGDPKCPWYVKRAKKIKYLIGLKAEIGEGEDVYDIETGAFSSRSEEQVEEEQEGITQQSTQETTQQSTQETTQQESEEQQGPRTEAPTTTQQQFRVGPPLAQPSQLTLDEPPDVVTVPSQTTPRTPTTTAAAAARRTPTPEQSSVSNSSRRTRSPTGGPTRGEGVALLSALHSCIELQMKQLAHQTKVQERAEARVNELREQAMKDAREARAEARRDRLMVIQALQGVAASTPTGAVAASFEAVAALTVGAVAASTGVAASTASSKKRPARVTLKKRARRQTTTTTTDDTDDSSSVSISD